MMRSVERTKYSARDLLLMALVLAIAACLLAGCGYVVKARDVTFEKIAYVWTLGSEEEAHAQLGETEAEGRRRHLRNSRINQHQLMADLDKIFLLDKPSKLTEKRIP
jgi:hypothetical protein